MAKKNKEGYFWLGDFFVCKGTQFYDNEQTFECFCLK